MVNLLNNRADACAVETFHCGNCGKDFEAKVITWVDVSRTPHVKRALLTWKFNTIHCAHCGCRHFAGTPFFFEDFAEGLLIAVFPRIPEKRGEAERNIREKYGYYPVLEFFYDMTQIWMLIYFQEHYKTNKDPRILSRLGSGEKRLRKMLHFLKEDPLMIGIREKLTESFFGDETNEDLADILGQAVSMLEEMLLWPLDRKCRCGADLTAGSNAVVPGLILTVRIICSRATMLFIVQRAKRPSGARLARHAAGHIPGSSARWLRMSAAQRETARPRLNTNRKLELKKRESGAESAAVRLRDRVQTKDCTLRASSSACNGHSSFREGQRRIFLDALFIL